MIRYESSHLHSLHTIDVPEVVNNRENSLEETRDRGEWRRRSKDETSRGYWQREREKKKKGNTRLNTKYSSRIMKGNGSGLGRRVSGREETVRGQESKQKQRDEKRLRPR